MKYAYLGWEGRIWLSLGFEQKSSLFSQSLRQDLALWGKIKELLWMCAGMEVRRISEYSAAGSSFPGSVHGSCPFPSQTRSAPAVTYSHPGEGDGPWDAGVGTGGPKAGFLSALLRVMAQGPEGSVTCQEHQTP